MGRTAFVDFKDHPPRAGGTFDTAKTRADRQPAGDAPYRAVEETRVAAFEAPDQFVDGQLELFRIGQSDGACALLARKTGPVHAVELRVEVVLRDLGDRLIVDGRPLLFG